MAWQDILGHDAVADQFRHAIRTNRLASTFLFVGPAGVGKRTFADRFAQALLCKSPDPSDPLAACGHCLDCRQSRSGNHPDLEVVRRPAEKSNIPIALFKGDATKGIQGLCAKIAIKPSAGGRKIAIIDDADFISEDSANALLKTLEEPPPRAVLILIGTSEQTQLPTIRSRCQVIRFQRLSAEQVAQILIDGKWVEDPKSAAQYARAAQGTVSLAWADPQLAEFRPKFFAELAKLDGSVAQFAKEIGKIVDAAGRDAQPVPSPDDVAVPPGAAKRARQALLMQAAADLYRQVVLLLNGQPLPIDTEDNDPIIQAAARLAENWPADVESAVACVERCLLAVNHVYSMANQATNLEAWLDDLAILSRGEPTTV